MAGRGYRAMRSGLGKAMPMIAAAAGAAALGAWPSAAAMLGLAAFGEWLQRFAMARARRSAPALERLAPSSATVFRDGEWRLVPTDRIAAGECVLVHPGARIPLDGTVKSGRSAIDRSEITGERAPVIAEPGEPVYAGSRNGADALTVEVTRTSVETGLAGRVHAMTRARERRAPTELLLERWTAGYLATVIAAGACAMLVALLGPHAGWARQLRLGLELWALAGPGGLAVAAALPAASALGLAARGGISAEGAAALEQAARIDTVALDMTGALTAGAPVVRAFFAADSQALAFARAVSDRSAHPAGKAIARYARERGVPAAALTAERGVAGGVEALIAGRRVLIGGEALMRRRGISLARLAPAVQEMKARGWPLRLIAIDGQAAGVFGLEDALRPDISETLAALREAGAVRVVLLTDEHVEAARKVGEAAGCRDIRGELTPAGRHAEVVFQQRHGRRVALITGDTEDASALAAADLGVAMGGAARPARIAAAPAALMAGSIARLPDLLRIGRMMMTVVRTNIGLCVTIKLAAFGLLAAGGMTLWLAALCEAAAMMLVVWNSWRSRPMAEPDRQGIYRPAEGSISEG